MEQQYCPLCGASNAAGFRFCQKCGASLAAGQLPAGLEPQQKPVSPLQSAPPIKPPSRIPPQPIQLQDAAYITQPIGQMGTGGFSMVDIWGPFAGYGERGRHVSWLLDNLGGRAEVLREATAQRFAERQIPGAKIEPRTLTGRGILVERRPYHLLRRGIATAGLYIARFGQDLYISQVTYAKGAINPLRALVLTLMVLFQAYLVFGYASSISSATGSALGSFNLLSGYSGGGGGGGALGFLLCCIGPVGGLNTAALMLAGLHMAYKFLTEKDPLALLRTPPNEFQLDDIVALEKAVEETVRQSLDRVGIDAALMTPPVEYGFKRRLI